MASETLAKIDRAYDVASALCEGEREWLMSIPARPDHDPDLIIGDALLAAGNEIARLTCELEEARERERGYREALCQALDRGFPGDTHEGDCAVTRGMQCDCWIGQARALAAHPTNRSESDE